MFIVRKVAVSKLKRNDVKIVVFSCRWDLASVDSVFSCLWSVYFQFVIRKTFLGKFNSNYWKERFTHASMCKAINFLVSLVQKT